MRCFYVLVHGKLDWTTKPPQSDDADSLRPAGFYCHRFVLAPDEEGAAEKAFRRVRDNLDKQTGWLSEGAANLQLEAEEVDEAPVHKLLKPDNRGHTFYEEE